MTELAGKQVMMKKEVPNLSLPLPLLFVFRVPPNLQKLCTLLGQRSIEPQPGAMLWQYIHAMGLSSLRTDLDF